ncbi:hypothetical protein ACFVT5_34960 [Streptomyces sp. NPDC058001]|uniref:hypothetical protein n=1 Tax=Streptomyces sp. NPDC058001 TaxID=3346300 RepID=UPI0036E38253
MADPLKPAASDPSYRTALLTRLFKPEELDLPCARDDHHLTAQQKATALAIDGGPDADEDITPGSWCPLRPHHSGPHYALLRYLTGDKVVWIRWLGPVNELVTLTDCTRSTTHDHTCPLFTGHPGTCPPPRTD